MIDTDCRTDTPAVLLEHNVHDDFAQARALKTAWDDLAARCSDLFCSYDWCEAWWQHYGHGRRLQIHVFRHADRMVGVLPLFVERFGLSAAGLRVIRLLGSDHTLDAAGLALLPEYADACMTCLLDTLANQRAWDILQLGPLRGYMKVAEQIERACARHPDVQVVLIGRHDNWLSHYEIPETYEAYLQTLSGNQRRDSLRRQRKLSEAHRVEVRTVHDPAEVPAAMDDLVQLHQALWRGKGQRGQFVDWPGYEAFHRDVAQRLARAGRLALVRFEVDGQVVAVSYGGHFGSRTHTMIRGQCDEQRWTECSLGRLLNLHMIRNAIERGSNAVDDGRGVFAYKLRLGARLQGERSVTALRRGRGRRLRFWAAMRMAYLVHLAYGRIWFDTLAPRLGVDRPLRAFYIRSQFLAQLFRRVRFRLFGGPKVVHARCLTWVPPESLADPADRTVVSDLKPAGNTGAADE